MINTKYIKIIYPLLLIIIIIISCNNNVSDYDNGFDNEHFIYTLYNGLTNSDIIEISIELENNYYRILSDLHVDVMPTIRIKIWSDYSSFEQAMLDDLGQIYNGATGYLYGPEEIRMYLNHNTEMIAVHEFAHTVSMQVNPSIPNNPRWLWEAIACYEGGPFYDPKTNPYLVRGQYPNLAELNIGYNNSNRSIYSVGYVLLEYIIDTWGSNTVIELIKQNGNINTVFGTSVTDFENGWYKFIEEKYLM
ncbi:hypothetical protein ACFL5D_02120 [Candidatus Neomarinimicrobiota bacterium]